MSYRLAAAFVPVFLTCCLAHATNVPEVEHNNGKGTATPALNMLPGDTISGATVGATQVLGLESTDYFRVQTAPAPPAIYRYRLVFTSTTPGHSISLRGLDQINRVPQVPSDPSAQDSVTTSSPPRYVQWYGFGRSEQVYVRIDGTIATPGGYVGTLERQTVVAGPVPTPIAAGPVTLSTVNQTTTDTDMWLYNSALAPIANYGNDDALNHPTVFQSEFTRTLTPGRYYIALSDYDLANDQIAATDDRYVIGLVTDFPDIALCSSPDSGLNCDMSITSATGTVLRNATKTEPFQVLWHAVDVVPVPLQITVQPVGASHGCDQLITLSATAVGPSTPIHFQWRRNGVNLVPGTTPRRTGETYSSLSSPATSVLTISPMQQADAGTYDVVVTDQAGQSVTSQPAVLTADCCCDNLGWTQRSTVGPSGRYRAAMAYSPSRVKTVLFGGEDYCGVWGCASLGIMQDTWEWDGPAGTWTLVNTPVAPPPRNQTAMARDDMGELILFGGLSNGSSLGDTWKWTSGGVWQQLSPAVSPSPRQSHAMAYDSHRGVIVLYGGQLPGISTFSRETWEWSGGNWHLRTPATTVPPVQAQHLMTYDPVSRRVLLANGGSTAGPNFDVWAWDGQDWSRANVTSLPYTVFVGAFHATQCGGILKPEYVYAAAGSPFRDYRFDSLLGLWTIMPRRSPLVPHVIASGAPSAYDSDRDRIIWFLGQVVPCSGGHNGCGIGATWEFGRIAHPTNDSCATATSIGVGAIDFGTCGANTDAPLAPCPSAQHLWYRYTPACAGDVVVSTCGSAFDTVIDVFQGGCSALAHVACNDNAPSGTHCAGQVTSELVFTAAANTPYFIRVGGAPASPVGSGVLSVSRPGPPIPTCPTTGAQCHRSFRVVGAASGANWGWSISKDCTMHLGDFNVPGIANGQPASALAAQFVSSVNGVGLACAALWGVQGSGQFTDSFTLQTMSGGPCDFVLRVGAANTPEPQMCLVTALGLPTTGPCSFNPTIVELPPSGYDCNENGTDDTHEIIQGVLADENHNMLADMCEPLVCDSIDFNGDGLLPDSQDVNDFLSVFSGGPCSTGACGDIDFNNDGLFPDTADIDSLLSVFSGGACL